MFAAVGNLKFIVQHQLIGSHRYGDAVCSILSVLKAVEVKHGCLHLANCRFQTSNTH